MAHDYDHQSPEFPCSWSWKEILYSDIVTAVHDNNLQHHDAVNFTEVAWACFKK
jgi:hypothetical protein